ncbi:hypothetical protein J1614_010960 [Plenodomus biglobosus]|nr:hypothetical protein J1614_010960 [Plenodomus biglobosus]
MTEIARLTSRADFYARLMGLHSKTLRRLRKELLEDEARQPPTLSPAEIEKKRENMELIRHNAWKNFKRYLKTMKELEELEAAEAAKPAQVRRVYTYLASLDNDDRRYAALHAAKVATGHAIWN